MKTSMKILSASVALAALTMSGAANAAIQLTSGSGTGELYLTAFDAAGQQSYSRDLGILQTDFLANSSKTLSYNLNTLDTGAPDAYWAKFIGTGSMGVGVVFTVSSANKVFTGPLGFTTSSPSPVANIYGNAINFNSLSKVTDSFNEEARSLDGNAYNTNGATLADSMTDASVNLSTYSVPGDGGYFGLPTWSNNAGGKNFNTISDIGKSVPYYSLLLNLTDGQYDNVDVVKLPNEWKLDPNGTLTYSAVPVPAALWLFGSGLLGMAGISRRRKV